MGSNIEIKAKLENPEETIARIHSLGYKYFSTIKQEDTYFNCQTGRLKLRIENGQRGELIFYLRSDSTTPKLSRYERITVQDFTLAREIFSQALGETGRIIKSRKVYFTCQTRIHLDTVEGLGDFIELETILKEDQSETEGREICLKILSDLDISEENLIAGSYIDLLIGKKR